MPLLILIGICIFVTLPFKAEAAVIISEVHPQPESGNEWIELANTGPAPVQIGGWWLEDELSSPSKMVTFAATQQLEVGSLFTIEVTNKLNNSGDGVTLKDITGNSVDTVRYSSSSLGQSWSRLPGSDTFELQSPTRDSANHLPIPTPTPSPSPDVTLWPSPSPSFDPYDITLSEIMACPGENQSEWVELFNTTDQPVSLEEWRITDWAGNTRAFTVNLPPKSLTSISWLSSMLNNSGDSVFLESNVGDLIAAASFSQCSQNQSFIWSGNQWQLTTTPTVDAQNRLTVMSTPSPSASPRASPKPSSSLNPKASASPTPQILGVQTKSEPTKKSLTSQSLFSKAVASPATKAANLKLTPSTSNFKNQSQPGSEFIAVRPSKINLWSPFSVILGGLLIVTNSASVLYDYYEKFLTRPLA